MKIPARQISRTDRRHGCARAAGLSEERKPRRSDPRRGSGDYWSRGSQRAMWVAPSSAGCSSLTRRQRTQFGPSSGAADLEVQVGLAARLRDLAPAGADLVPLTGIHPMIGRLVGHLVDRNDADRGGDVKGLEGAGEGAVVELGEGAEGDRHHGSPEVGSQDPFLRWLACRDRNGCGYHRERARGRSKAEDLQDGKICSAAAARRPACRPGKFFRRAG